MVKSKSKGSAKLRHAKNKANFKNLENLANFEMKTRIISDEVKPPTSTHLMLNDGYGRKGLYFAADRR